MDEFESIFKQLKPEAHFDAVRIVDPSDHSVLKMKYINSLDISESFRHRLHIIAREQDGIGRNFRRTLPAVERIGADEIFRLPEKRPIHVFLFSAYHIPSDFSELQNTFKAMPFLLPGRLRSFTR